MNVAEVTLIGVGERNILNAVCHNISLDQQTRLLALSKGGIRRDVGRHDAMCVIGERGDVHH